MKEVQLTQGYVALIDDEDFEKVSQRKWCVLKITRKDGSVRGLYAQSRIEGVIVLLHRFLLGITNPNIKIDHKDRNGLNCQRTNLRKAGKANAHNAKKRIDNTSGFKGVSWKTFKSGRGKWGASIFALGEHLHLGNFDDPLEAACAYDMAAVKYFGKFASCNFAEPS